MTLRPNPSLLEIAAYVGGESAIPGIAQPIKLSSNEGAFGAPPAAIEAARAATGHMHRYPDGGATRLRQALGRLHGIDPDRIVCGTGSDEIIQLLTRAYLAPGDELIHGRHGFAMYPIAALGAFGRPVAVAEPMLKLDVDALLAAITPKTRALFVANPNNPTGSMLKRAEIERLLNGVPENVLVLLDLAYAEYVDDPDYDDGFAAVQARPNVVVTRTFSKIYGLGGMRIGWAYAQPAVIDVLNRIRGVFNVASVSLAAAEAALGDREHVRRSAAHNRLWRAWTADECAARGLKTYPSEGNFILFDTGLADGEPVRRALKQRGVIVRQMGSYGLPRLLRVSIGLEAEMRAFILALDGALEETAALRQTAEPAA